MLPCPALPCTYASDMYPVCQQWRVTAQKMLAQRLSNQSRGCLHRFCRRTDTAPRLLVEGCMGGVPYGRSVSAPKLGEEAGGCILFCCYILPGASSLSWYVHYYSIFAPTLPSFVCRVETSGIPPR